MEIKFLDKRMERNFEPATDLAAGYDLRSTVHAKLYPGETVKIPTGVAVHMDSGDMADMINDQRKDDLLTMIPCAVIMPRSGLGCKGIRPRNAPGLIDADYQGELVVCLYNESDDVVEVQPMDRIAQLVFMFAAHPKFKTVKEFSDSTKRGTGGFGSTGKQ